MCTGFWHVCLRILTCVQDLGVFTGLLADIVSLDSSRLLINGMGETDPVLEKGESGVAFQPRTDSCHCAVVTQKVHTSRTELDYIEVFLAVRLKSAFLRNLWSESHFPCLWQRGNLALHWLYLWLRLSAHQSPSWPPGSHSSCSKVPLYISMLSRCCRPRGEWLALPRLFSRNFFHYQYW